MVAENTKLSVDSLLAGSNSVPLKRALLGSVLGATISQASEEAARAEQLAVSAAAVSAERKEGKQRESKHESSASPATPVDAAAIGVADSGMLREMLQLGFVTRHFLHLLSAFKEPADRKQQQPTEAPQPLFLDYLACLQRVASSDSTSNQRLALKLLRFLLPFLDPATVGAERASAPEIGRAHV